MRRAWCWLCYEGAEEGRGCGCPECRALEALRPAKELGLCEECRRACSGLLVSLGRDPLPRREWPMPVDRTFNCSLCDSRMVPTPVNFPAHGRLWSLVVWICQRPSCLERRGGVGTELVGPELAAPKATRP